MENLDFSNNYFVAFSEIVKNADYDTLINICMTNNENSEFCRNPSVWRYFLQRDYGVTLTNGDPRQKYLWYKRFSGSDRLGEEAILNLVPYTDTQTWVLFAGRSDRQAPNGRFVAMLGTDLIKIDLMDPNSFIRREVDDGMMFRSEFNLLFNINSIEEESIYFLLDTPQNRRLVGLQ